MNSADKTYQVTLTWDELHDLRYAMERHCGMYEQQAGISPNAIERVNALKARLDNVTKGGGGDVRHATRTV